MKKKNFELYIKHVGNLLKDNAMKAKSEANHPKEGEADYNTGYLMAYHEVIAIMKNRAPLFKLGQKEIGLANIEPERDLI